MRMRPLAVETFPNREALPHDYRKNGTPTRALLVHVVDGQRESVRYAGPPLPLLLK